MAARFVYTDDSTGKEIPLGVPYWEVQIRLADRSWHSIKHFTDWVDVILGIENPNATEIIIKYNKNTTL